MIIGLDIGATHIRIISRVAGKVRGEKVHTPLTLSAFKKTLGGLIKAQAQKISGIGVGVAGFVTPGRVAESPNIKFLSGFGLAKFLKKEFKVPVVLDNDAACFLRAEVALGAAKKCKSVLGVTVGSGLGGAFYKNKKIIKGQDLKGGEIGHRPFRAGELEDYASAKFLDKIRDFKKLGQNLAEGLGPVILKLKPECIVFGGGITANPRAPEFIKSFKSGLRHAETKIKNPPRILVSKFGEFAGALGAALQMERAHGQKRNKRRRQAKRGA